MTSAFSWQISISLCPASFHTPRPNSPVTPGKFVSISFLLFLHFHLENTYLFSASMALFMFFMSAHLFCFSYSKYAYVHAKLLQLCPTLLPYGPSPPGSSGWDSPGKGCCALLFGSFGPNDRTCVSYPSGIGRHVLYHQHHLGSPFQI